jgi:hypothetical protein
VNTANRVLWSVFGALLVLAGAAGILASRGWLPGVGRHRLLFPADAGATWDDWGAWAPVLTITAGVLVALLGLWLLRAELRVHDRPSLPDPTLRTPAGPGEAGGRTRIDTAVLAKAMRRDLQSDPAIKGAHVRITGRPEHPEVSVRLEVEQGADLHPVRGHVDRALDRLAATMPGSPTIDQVLVSTAGGRSPGRRVA